MTLPVPCLYGDKDENWRVNGSAGENMERIVAHISLLLIMICANVCLAQNNPEINNALKIGNAAP